MNEVKVIGAVSSDKDLKKKNVPRSHPVPSMLAVERAPAPKAGVRERRRPMWQALQACLF